MVSCAKSTFVTSTPPSMTPTHLLGVSRPFSSATICCPPSVVILYPRTLAHPTLNRHTPPEIVANFKRRVPPRLPKPRRRPDTDQHPAIPPPSASGLGAAPLNILGLTSSPKGERARGLYAFGSNPPLAQAGTTGKWGDNYNRALCTSEEEPRNGPRRVDYLNGRDRLQILPKLLPDGSISLPTSTPPTLVTLPGTSVN